jgi:cytochrome P450
MAAGFETTSHAITWTLAALAAHPDIQQQLVEELASLGLAAAAGAGSRADPRSVSDVRSVHCMFCLHLMLDLYTVCSVCT